MCQNNFDDITPSHLKKQREHKEFREKLKIYTFLPFFLPIWIDLSITNRLASSTPSQKANKNTKGDVEFT